MVMMVMMVMVRSAFTDNIKIRMLEKKLPLIAPRFLKATGTSIVAGLMNVKKSTLAPA